MKQFSSRKFLFSCAVVVIATGLRVAELIDARDWVSVALAVTAAYLTANVAQKKVAP